MLDGPLDLDGKPFPEPDIYDIDGELNTNQRCSKLGLPADGGRKDPHAKAAMGTDEP